MGRDSKLCQKHRMFYVRRSSASCKGIDQVGIRTPDQVYDPEEYMAELKKRGVVLHERKGMFDLPQ